MNFDVVKKIISRNEVKEVNIMHANQWGFTGDIQVSYWMVAGEICTADIKFLDYLTELRNYKLEELGI